MVANQVVGQVDVPLDPASGAEDVLEISNYYRGLAKFIQTCQTPMTIAVQGDWGSGKTTALNFIRYELDSARRGGANAVKTKIVEFNTWQYSQFDLGDTLIFSMVHEIMAPLVGKSDKAKKYLRAMFRIGRDVALSAARQAGTTAGVGFATDAIIDSLEDTAEGGSGGNLATQIKKLKFEFSTAIDDYCKSTSTDRVVVIIDDLDRVDPERAVEVMEALKVFFDCPNCVFVLAIDFDVVARGVREKYGHDIEQSKAKSFFDKIIQVPFRMPVDQFKMGSLLSESLQKIGVQGRAGIKEVTSRPYEAYIEAARTSVGNNPRSTKRLINTFELLKIIIDGQDRGGDYSAIDELIIFMLLCTQTSYPEFHKEIVRSLSLGSTEVIEMLEDALRWDNEDRPDSDSAVTEGVGEKVEDTLQAVESAPKVANDVEQNADTELAHRRLVELDSASRAKRFGISETDRRSFDRFLVLLGRALSGGEDGQRIEEQVLRAHVDIASVTGAGSGERPGDAGNDMTTSEAERDARIENNAGTAALELVKAFERALVYSVGSRPVCSSAQSANIVSFYAASDTAKVLEMGPRARPKVLAISYSGKGLRLQFGKAIKKGAVEGKRFGREWLDLAHGMKKEFGESDGTSSGPKFREMDTGSPFVVDGLTTVEGIDRLVEFLPKIYSIAVQAGPNE